MVDTRDNNSLSGVLQWIYKYAHHVCVCSFDWFIVPITPHDSPSTTPIQISCVPLEGPARVWKPLLFRLINIQLCNLMTVEHKDHMRDEY